MTTLSVVPEAEVPARSTPPSMLDRMTLIMECFSARAASRTLEDVAAATHLPRSTTHRILVDLVRLGWLALGTEGYCLGHRQLMFGGGDEGHGRLREATAETLHDLALRTGMVVHLAVLSDSEIHYLDKVGGRFAAQIPSRVGGRAPAHSTALGKAMLAWLSPEQVDLQLEGSLGRLTNRTISRLPTLHQELGRIRSRHGLAFERGECFPDIACVAAAIRSPEGPVASISLCGEAGVPLEKVAPLVAHAARATAEELFPRRKSNRNRPSVAPLEETWSTEAMDALLSVGSGSDWI
ncbi:MULTISPECIES: IclR family transcriptional regulator [unclassified Nocardioides]|uniref:IclR family transcriptional regulator n=1 Tax=unclassified Nocardioides TaxID=2615069 RepID=UPI000701A615|nr:MULTISPECIES: IclR family transcriptional regulator [unclassified Nocardioides]KQY54283.1 IclR family transcriptional regulator [Nocardioides sp. Root140]KQZ74905.1 IclR family transcriptional regulator [Nocardioides sp. Root151]